MVAAIISTDYGIVMTAVAVAISINIVTESLMSPISWFLLLMTSQIVLAALLHPYEVSCLMHGLIYYLAIPSMYLLLIIYSLCNLNNISWGTRETKTKKNRAVITTNPHIPLRPSADQLIH